MAVIGIVGVLAALGIPAAMRASVSAKSSACAANLRQIGMGILLYAADNGGNLPPTTHVTGVNFRLAWIYALGPYLDDVDKVRICPADPLGGSAAQGQGNELHFKQHCL